ncbi:four helix bundle protein [Flavobacterium sp.]|uniref:four helix bundle protein n=1 Tax=Flavobacterium sp. TaxID=239 RepID=UPI003D0C37B1
MRTYSFEKLIVWQKAIAFTVAISKLTKQFPKEEMFGLSSQIRRSSRSISTNIAEGSGKHSLKEKSRFTEYSYSSSLETINHLIEAYQLEYITNEQYVSFRERLDEINAMLDALYKSQTK